MKEMLASGPPAAIEKALDVAAYRQSLIASNIANVDTPGYRARDISFAEELRTAARAAVDPEAPSPEVGSTLREIATGRMRGDGNTVDVDREMMNLARTAGFYTAAIEVMKKYIGVLKAAITEGRY